MQGINLRAKLSPLHTSNKIDPSRIQISRIQIRRIHEE
jgi:hypothetical protein